jgi:hypothetical protein
MPHLAWPERWARKLMRTTVTTLTASVIAVLLLTGPAEARERRTTCQHTHLLRAYSANYHAVARLHGRRAPGRNIRRQGLTTGKPSTCGHLRKSLRTLRSMMHHGSALLSPSLPRVPPAQTATLRTTRAPLSGIRSCESGGSYSAVSQGGRYRGAYQFDQRTWNSVGGSGDPAAASPAEQDRRAAILYSRRGSSPWPVCGR